MQICACSPCDLPILHIPLATGSGLHKLSIPVRFVITLVLTIELHHTGSTVPTVVGPIRLVDLTESAPFGSNRDTGYGTDNGLPIFLATFRRVYLFRWHL
jgi:hypothetical protein